MGAGRKTRTIFVKRDSRYPDPISTHGSARNLPKGQLGGVIFGCKNTTIDECLTRQLFGLPAHHFSYVKNISAGLPLFLFNYSDRKLHGIFEAASHGQMNINPYGWTTDGSERTPYPAQVQIRVRLQCQPLLEEQFRPIIADNYYINHHFWFELDHTEVSKLMSLLASLPVAANTCLPHNRGKWRNAFRPLSSTDVKEEGKRVERLSSEVGYAKHLSRAADSSDVAHEMKEEIEMPNQFSLGIDQSNYSSTKSDSRDDSINGHNQPSEVQLDMKMEEQDEKELVLMKLKELALNCGRQDFASTHHVDGPAILSDVHLNKGGFLGEQMRSNGKNDENHCSSSHCQSFIAELIQGMEDLKAFKNEQTLKMKNLEQKLVEAEAEIQRLKVHSALVESESDPSIESIDEKATESSEELHFDPTESIYLVGGYNGESWLSTMESYMPSYDQIKPFKSLSSVRSYASVALFNGDLYVLGGGDGHVWYNSVESYSPVDDRWTLCPALNGKKGSLGGASVNEKIFAIGGGNGVDCFSDVEMLDLDIGRWIRTRSMLQKRFALAAVELNGAIYATGGYDGNDYLNSAERFDPREHSWSRIASMNTKRGCHSLVVLNGKLYAVGGFDGNAMSPSVEIYDPRLETWMSGEPMKQSRGYSAAAVMKDAIYVIGGVKSGSTIVDTVECFKEGQGWHEINSTVIGKRCFLSAATF